MTLNYVISAFLFEEYVVDLRRNKVDIYIINKNIWYSSRKYWHDISKYDIIF